MKRIIVYIIIGFAITSAEEFLLNENPIVELRVLDQERALVVLQTKCNTCHKTENPSKYFTHDNMNGFAKKINRQVFIWKRMPKGKENYLTEKEKEDLKNWIIIQIK